VTWNDQIWDIEAVRAKLEAGVCDLLNWCSGCGCGYERKNHTLECNQYIQIWK